MRILVDYRAALRERTGVGEYIHRLVQAYAAAHPGDVALFTSSWKDRPAADLTAEVHAQVIDRRIPVRVLNLLWHRAQWPPVETLAGCFDVIHSAHPLLIPARRAAQVITIHDLFFLSQPERTHGEIRRDYPALAAAHAQRAHAVVTSTQHGKRLVSNQLGVPPDRIYVCPPGAPRWNTLGRAPNVPPNGYLLFVGTLEPRKNVGALLDAYTLLVRRMAAPPPLVLAGRATPDAAAWLARLEHPPLAGRVRHLGYVSNDRREELYAGARALVLTSLDEGFGLTALEAMSAGVAVVASNRGSLPEVVGTGGTLLDPDDVEGFAAAMQRLASDEGAAAAAGAAGLTRARDFMWNAAAATLRRAYTDAVARRQRAGRGGVEAG
jgi:glycosyltransferase involved in cell wall biosynthesis